MNGAHLPQQIGTTLPPRPASPLRADCLLIRHAPTIRSLEHGSSFRTRTTPLLSSGKTLCLVSSGIQDCGLPLVVLLTRCGGKISRQVAGHRALDLEDAHQALPLETLARRTYVCHLNKLSSRPWCRNRADSGTISGSPSRCPQSKAPCACIAAPCRPALHRNSQAGGVTSGSSSRLGANASKCLTNPP